MSGLTRDSVARGTLINVLTRVLGLGLGLLLMLITARLGPQGQGGYALFAAVESALLTLGSGFGVALARRVSQRGDCPADLVGAMLAAGALGGLLAAALLLACAGPLAADSMMFSLLALVAPILLLTSTLSGLWLGHAQMVALARLNLAVPALTLLGILLAYWLRGVDLLAVLLAWSAARLLVALASWEAARRRGWIARPNWSQLGADWGFVALVGLTNLMSLLNYKADLFLVEHFLGRSATGVYSIAVMVAEMLWLVSSSVTQAAYARIGHPDAEAAGRLTLRVVHVNLLALLLLTPLIWLAARLLLLRLLGPAYAESLPVLAVLLPGVLSYGAASALSAYFTNHAGKPWIPALLVSLSLLINLMVSLVWIPRLGLIGAALATTVSYGLSIALSMTLFARMAGLSARQICWPDWHGLGADLRRLLGRIGRRLGLQA